VLHRPVELAGLDRRYPISGSEAYLGDHCCDMMKSNLRDGETVIRFYPKFRDTEYSFSIEGLASSRSDTALGVASRSPHLYGMNGSRSSRQKGLEPEDAAIPQEMTSDAWWKIPSRVGVGDAKRTCRCSMGLVRSGGSTLE
jgi:hypothetical protein